MCCLALSITISSHSLTKVFFSGFWNCISVFRHNSSTLNLLHNQNSDFENLFVFFGKSASFFRIRCRLVLQISVFGAIFPDLHSVSKSLFWRAYIFSPTLNQIVFFVWFALFSIFFILKKNWWQSFFELHSLARVPIITGADYSTMTIHLWQSWLFPWF